MKRNWRRILSGVWAMLLFISGLTVPAYASEKDPYVIQYAPQILASNYEYSKPYLHVTPFTSRSYCRGSLLSDTVVIYNLINTTKLTGTGEGPYASIATYRMHPSGNLQRGDAYQRINLENCGFSQGVAGKIRAVLLNGFPYLSDVKQIEKEANIWLEQQGLTPIQNLQSGEVMLAVQCAIWKLVHGELYITSSLYSGIRKMQTDRIWKENVVFQEEMEQKPTSNTSSNIESLYQYYFHIPAAEPQCVILGADSFRNIEYTTNFKEHDQSHVTVDFELDASVGINDVMLLTAICGTQKQVIPITNQKTYQVRFDKVPSGEAVQLHITGYQYGEDIYLFAAEDNSLQSALIGFDNSCLPVDAQITVTADCMKKCPPEFIPEDN